MMIDNRNAGEFAKPGGRVVDSDGAILGSITHVYADVESGAPGWVSVKSDALTLEVFLPLGGSRLEGDNLIMPVVMTKTIDQISVPTLVTHRILHKDVKGFNGSVGSFTAPAGHVRESLIQQEDNLRRSAEALEQIYLAAGLTVHTTPQVARSVQAQDSGHIDLMFRRLVLGLIS